MKEKTHYVIAGYFEPEERKVCITVYKLQRIGLHDRIYGWITIDDYYGIGTNTDDFGYKDKGEALMSIINFLPSSYKSSIARDVYTNDFEEVLESRSKIKEALYEQNKETTEEIPL